MSHERPEGTARRNFNQNREHLIEYEDFYNVPYAEWSQIIAVRNSYGDSGTVLKQRNPVKFLTQPGYLMVVKTFQDDLAWEVQRSLVRFYFAVKSGWMPDREDKIYRMVRGLVQSVNDLTRDVSTVKQIVMTPGKTDRAGMRETLIAFLEEYYENSPVSFVPKEDFYHHYKAWMKFNHPDCRVLKYPTFFKKVYEVRPADAGTRCEFGETRPVVEGLKRKDSLNSFTPWKVTSFLPLPESVK